MALMPPKRKPERFRLPEVNIYFKPKTGTVTSTQSSIAPASASVPVPAPIACAASSAPVPVTVTRIPNPPTLPCSECLCTICNCSRHGCPPTPHSAHYSPHLLSEHGHRYRGGGQAPPRAHEPNRTSKLGSSPFDGSSTYRNDYHAHPDCRSVSAPLSHSTGVENSNSKFRGNSTHRHDYKAFPNSATYRGRPATTNTTRRPIEETRDFLSENRAEFDRKPINQIESCKPQSFTGQSAPFRGNSTSRIAYRPFSAVSPGRPTYSSSSTVLYSFPDDRNFCSEYRQEYHKRPTPLPCPAAPLQVNTKSLSGHIFVKKDQSGHYNYVRKP